MNKMMKSLVVDKQGSLKLVNISVPRITDYQALVKTIACGICNGTDGKLIHKEFKKVDADQYPIMLGHEAVGRVIEVGSKVKSYHMGDIVLLPFVGSLEGYGSAWGAFSEYGIVDDISACVENGITPDKKEFPINSYIQNILPSYIDPLEGVIIITLREVLSGIRYFGLQPNDSVVVFGCGPVGLIFIKLMHLMGIDPIIAVDIINEKLVEAQDNGAKYIFNGNDDHYKDSIRKICPKGVKYVIDAVGVSNIINQAMEIIKDRGKICCYGISSNLNMNLDWSKGPYNWHLIFQQMPEKREEQEAYAQVLAWIDAGLIQLRDFISDIYDFEDVISAFENVEKKQIAKKCIIRM